MPAVMECDHGRRKCDARAGKNEEQCARAWPRDLVLPSTVEHERHQNATMATSKSGRPMFCLKKSGTKARLP
jgi:hypothetical protein